VHTHAHGMSVCRHVSGMLVRTHIHTCCPLTAHSHAHLYTDYTHTHKHTHYIRRSCLKSDCNACVNVGQNLAVAAKRQVDPKGNVRQQQRNKSEHGNENSGGGDTGKKQASASGEQARGSGQARGDVDVVEESGWGTSYSGIGTSYIGTSYTGLPLPFGGFFETQIPAVKQIEATAVLSAGTLFLSLSLSPSLSLDYFLG
jgi:hypothetical protein